MTPRNLQPLTGRTFLLLQGPQSGFFRVLAEKLVRAGAAVHKVHFCGGDAALWGLKKAYWYTGDLYRWIGWVGNLYRKLAVTDVCVYGDTASAYGFLKKGICEAAFPPWKKAASTAARRFRSRPPRFMRWPET